jgi:hypothetical protein
LVKHENIVVVDFNKGFYAPSHEEQLKELLDAPVLPKKGKLSEHAITAYFREARQRHSGIEAAILALENHGLRGFYSDTNY